MTEAMTRASHLGRLFPWLALIGLVAALTGFDADGQSGNLLASVDATTATPPAKNGAALAALLTPDGRLRFPADYREWIFLSSGHGMSYTPGPNTDDLPFDNVFVDPASYRSFLKSGTWPEGTIFVLEIRPGRSQGSINKRGSFQHGAPDAVEVHAKDSKRFSTGWAFFNFSGTKATKPIPTEADCYSCHQQHGAVDTTFVQFYPTVLPTAEQKRTLTRAYLESLAK